MSIESGVILTFTDMIYKKQKIIPIAHISAVTQFDTYVCVNMTDGSTYHIACIDETLHEKIKYAMQVYYLNMST